LALRNHLHDREARIFAAEEVLVDDCMQARGMIYVPIPPPAPGWGRDVDPRQDPSLDDAREWGLGLVRQPVPEPDANSAHLERLGEEERRAWDAALTGTSGAKVAVELPDGHRPYMLADGCVAQAKIILYGSIEAYLRANFGAQSADQRLLNSALDSDTYRRATSRWSTCMGRVGHRYPDPQKMTTALAGRENLTFRTEQRAAMASARCAQAVRLGVVAALAYDRERSRHRELDAALRAWDDLRVAADQKATWVLKEAGIT